MKWNACLTIAKTCIKVQSLTTKARTILRLTAGDLR